MKLLLDTHIVLWAALEPERISQTARDMLVDPANTRLVSAASAWEIATKVALGKLPLPEPPQTFLDRAMADLCCGELPISMKHALAAATLVRHHNDPFDRLLVAQAITERATLVTADGALPPYVVHGLLLLWAKPS